VVAGEKDGAAEGMVFFFFLTGRGGEGVLESCVRHLFLVWVLVLSMSWRPRWWLGKLVLGARSGGFTSRASLRQLLAALFHHRVGLKGSRAAAPPQVVLLCFSPSGMSLVALLQAGARASMWRRKMAGDLIVFSIFLQGPLQFFRTLV
jgi:hypothetical protein